MDYEKKYKEALKRARQIKDGKEEWRYSDLTEITPALTEIFPELAESEDERIRQSLLAYIKGESKRLDTKKWIAYLEKQKPVEYLDKDKVYAIMTKLTNLSYSQLIPTNSDEFKKLHEITSEVRDLLDYPIEQKPSWSEEDEKNWKSYIERLESEYHKAPNVVLWDDINWLKSLHERLKSLCPQPSWKPSEEQMEALAYAIQLLDDGLSPKAAKAGEELEHLREQLKKL